MYKIIRRVCPAFLNALVLLTFALTPPGGASSAIGAFNSQESGDSKQQRPQPEELTFTQFDFPDALLTIATGINNRGDIVGAFVDTENIQHGFLLNDGAFIQIDAPDAAITLSARGINDRGQIVVPFQDDMGLFHGALLYRGAFSSIDAPGARETGPHTINNRGQIVGGFGDAAGAAHGFLATKEQFIGKAIGAGSDEETAAVEIFGTFTSPFDFDLSATTLTITNLLDERAGNGELASGPPLVLTAVSGSHRNLALFIDRSRPNIASVAILDAGADKFIFRIKIHDATINIPQQYPQASLTTSFRLEAMGKPPIVVSTERPWTGFGPSNRFLKTL